MANQFLALSLFIVLLSFFIVLNSMSSYDETKSQPVLNSLATALTQEEAEKDLSRNILTDSAQSIHEGETLDRLRALFTAQIANIDIQKNRLGTLMHIRVPVQQFDQEIMAAPVENSGEQFSGISERFLPMLISLLRSEDAIPYRMDIVLNVPENPAVLKNENPEDIIAHVQKAAGYTQKLEQAGLPSKLVTAGLGKGDPESVDLYFRVYEPFTPVDENATAAEEQ